MAEHRDEVTGKNARKESRKANPVNNDTAEHFGSREETQRALEQKVAVRNSRTLLDES